MNDAFPLLSDEELHELNQFLLHETGSDQAMGMSMLDGYLHAIAVGPTTISPARWLPAVWGRSEGLPPTASSPRFTRVLDLLMRHHNSLIACLESDPPYINPIWHACEYRGRTYPVVERWAYGFALGMRLCFDDWRPMLESAEGRKWYRPIGLLTQEAFCPEQAELIRTPARRARLADKIIDSVLAMHAYWIPHREAVAAVEATRLVQARTGRNEACPCGSGRKFKKCCGAPTRLH